MKNYKWSLFLMYLFQINCLIAQSDVEKNYYNSFENKSNMGVVNFESLFLIKNKMTRSEALKFVYKGDTSKLTCSYWLFDMISEKQGPLKKEYRLPIKCMRVDINGGTLIINSFYNCNDPRKPDYSFIEITLLSKTYELGQKLVVYKSKGEFPEISGLINTSNGNIFLMYYIEDSSSYDARLFSHNGLRFVLLKEKKDIKSVQNDWYKQLKSLGWSETFESTH